MLIELHPLIEVGEKKEHLYLCAEARQRCEMCRKLPDWWVTPNAAMSLKSLDHITRGNLGEIARSISKLQTIYSEWAAGYLIDCLIDSVWGCLRRGPQVYISSERSIFSKAMHLAL